MLNKQEVNFAENIKLLAKRSDGMGIYEVGTAKRDKTPIVVLSKSKPKVIEGLNLLPISSLLNFTDPDSLEWVD
ncbi:MAG: hypothetical protein ACRC78_02155 [Planktothrix sp.]